ncbi:hypothetical protein ZEAMMB73_Zm00001d013821 [Zea mays]|uniref:Uncharacterized protein n=1 Tax=Zea mays TaxID=4577 RepID=A0A1D6GME9_MAIZE|nr:hypothetical protein ZEAMMB73_Zm00001d013821 [Zea mays]
MLRVATGILDGRQPCGGRVVPLLLLARRHGYPPRPPHKNIARLLKAKRFRKPDISETIQELLGGKVGRGQLSGGLVVDVGANVGMASFVAAVMGFRVLAFDDSSPCSRICSGYSTGCTSTGCSTALWCITLRGCSF